MATTLIEWFSDKKAAAQKLPLYVLFSKLGKHKLTSTEAWPKTSKCFGDVLPRAAPALRQMGIECNSLGKIGSYVYWEIKALNL